MRKARLSSFSGEKKHFSGTSCFRLNLILFSDPSFIVTEASDYPLVSAHP